MRWTFYALNIFLALNSSSAVDIFFANISCMKQLLNEIKILNKNCRKMAGNIQKLKLINRQSSLVEHKLLLFISSFINKTVYANKEHQSDIFSLLSFLAASTHSLIFWGHTFSILAVSAESLHSAEKPVNDKLIFSVLKLFHHFF